MKETISITSSGQRPKFLTHSWAHPPIKVAGVLQSSERGRLDKVLFEKLAEIISESSQVGQGEGVRGRLYMTETRSFPRSAGALGDPPRQMLSGIAYKSVILGCL